MSDKIECKYSFYTCYNLQKEFYCKEICDNCDEGQNYQEQITP